ncbi:hypothetical protein IFM89_021067 [Coptis chinensis]|uniref:Pentatricopeptide repeat-containing protein n=1 Tax=Coptis chinensis TaxID=261450 RepID=A0A835H4V7_9MAGN|nr:hypothetical protein IFM89_021067 [Coptis chinensis]
MFVKCGKMEKMEVAREFFEEMEFKDVVVWNIMISGYALKGDLNRALKYFKGMELAGVQPDRVTWNSIISGYSQKGQFKEASNFFFKMRDLTEFKPNVVSWTVLITGN